MMENKPNIVFEHCADIDRKTETEALYLNTNSLYTVSEFIYLLNVARERFGDLPVYIYAFNSDCVCNFDTIYLQKGFTEKNGLGQGEDYVEPDSIILYCQNDYQLNYYKDLPEGIVHKVFDHSFRGKTVCVQLNQNRQCNATELIDLLEYLKDYWGNLEVLVHDSSCVGEYGTVFLHHGECKSSDDDEFSITCPTDEDCICIWS